MAVQFDFCEDLSSQRAQQSLLETILFAKDGATHNVTPWKYTPNLLEYA